MKISKRVKTGCALALAALLALPCVNLMQSKAAGPVIQDQECKLTIAIDAATLGADASAEDLKEMEIPVKLYKVASVDVSGTFTSTDAFKDIDFNVSMGSPDVNADAWKKLEEETVNVLKEAPETEASAEGMIEGGNAAVVEDLSVGMYLVAPEDTLNSDASTKYVFTPYLTALPSSDYTLTGEGSDEWEYEREITLKVEAEPQFGELIINKTLDNYNETLGPVTCVFQIDGTDKNGKVYSNVASITLDSAGTAGTAKISNIPAGMEVTVKEIYAGASYTYSGSDENREPSVVIVSDEAVKAGTAQASVAFTNRYDGGNRGGYGVTNEFTMQDGNWQWTTK